VVILIERQTLRNVGVVISILMLPILLPVPLPIPSIVIVVVKTMREAPIASYQFSVYKPVDLDVAILCRNIRKPAIIDAEIIRKLSNVLFAELNISHP
jgi:hypothetical protein